MLFRFISALLVLPAFAVGSDIDFNRDIRPILSDRCFACHGPDEHDRKAGLRLDTAEGAFADLGGYAAIVAGDPGASEAWLRITSHDEDDVMPPPELHKPLSGAEKDLLRRWIEAGGEYEGHWAYQPLDRPGIPETGTPATVPSNPIDRFIRTELDEQKLAPVTEADALTLIRRLCLDLTGLPPRPAQIQAFQDRAASDDAETAYLALIEDLLDSPAYGERMAVYWLDLVRYADTIGYHSDNLMEVSAYRDYVVEAFNRNLPYDRFTIEQLAGDLLPEPTLHQRIASGYNRLLQTTEEGGAQPKEYMAIYAADRVRNVSAVWMGSTVGCAQCHDHKYDPFTMRDFYSMAAFFSDVREKATDRRQPNLRLPTEAESAEIAQLEGKLSTQTLAHAVKSDTALASRVEAGQAEWETRQLERHAAAASAWRITKPKSAKSSGGARLVIRDDASVLSTGRNPDSDTYTVKVPASGRVTALRLEALTDPSLANGSLSRANGNFVLTNVQIIRGDLQLPIATATATFEQSGHPISSALDSGPRTGWAVLGHERRESQAAVFTLAEPLDLPADATLTIRLEHRSPHARHNIGRFRVALAEAPNPPVTAGLDLPVEVRDALLQPRDERSPEDRNRLAAHYRSLAPELASLRDQRAEWEQRLKQVRDGVQTMLVAESLDTPRPTRILDRGNWMDDSGEIVQPALPAFLANGVTPPAEGRLTRLDLAHWIVSESNPLTARTMVNRLWKLFFGKGLSANLEDLGGQGSPPSHPELLDWLAVEFQESGWDVQHLIRLMVTSETYRRSSIPTPSIRQADPQNRWYARQNRWRIEAEFVRDTALQISGLLVDDLGGRAVKPYQPAGYWQHLNFPKRKWEAGSGDDLYRRGLYTFWCRTFLHPAMLAFDAPSREECTAERPRSNIPQQALTLLNDPSFVEASRVFAQRIAQQPGDLRSRLIWAWTTATGRPPVDREIEVLTALHHDQLSAYQNRPDDARALIDVGEWPAPADADPVELAAWTQVGRAILNAYETTARF